MIKRLIKRVIKRFEKCRLITPGSCVVGGNFSPHTQPDHGNQVVWFVYRDLIDRLITFRGNLAQRSLIKRCDQVVAFPYVLGV